MKTLRTIIFTALILGMLIALAVKNHRERTLLAPPARTSIMINGQASD